jgi:hypothetical protein
MVRRPTLWRSVQIVGLFCLAIVVLTHVAEAFHIFPAMGWGLPDSVGHYIDLVSAVIGCILFPAGFLGEVITRRKKS